MKKTRYSDRGLRIYCFLLIQMIVADFLTLMLSTKDAYKKMPWSTVENQPHKNAKWENWLTKGKAERASA